MNKEELFVEKLRAAGSEDAPAETLTISFRPCGFLDLPRLGLVLRCCFWICALQIVLVLLPTRLGFTTRDFLALLLPGLAGVGLYFGVMRKHPIYTASINADRLLFDRHFSRSLFGRLSRPWSDVHEVSFMYTPDARQKIVWASKPGTTATRESSIVIKFKSGGEVRIPSNCITAGQAMTLFSMFEAFLPPESFERDAANLKHLVLSGKELCMKSIRDMNAQEAYFATNHQLLTSGVRLQSGKYCVRTQLSAGGMSATYLCTTTDGSTVVLKESAAPSKDSEQAIKAKELFQRETNLLARLNHPRLARILDAFTENDHDYIVLQHIRGSNLRELITKTGNVKRQQAIAWTRDLCEIVSYLHQQVPPVLHRDISPDNIVIGENSHLFLIDFGAATEYLNNQTGTFVGKQAYISPEQLRGHASPASDIYSIGATFYFMIVGKDPRPLTCLHLEAKTSTKGDKCDEIISRCTELDEADRFQTVGELMRRLDEMTIGSKS